MRFGQTWAPGNLKFLLIKLGVRVVEKGQAILQYRTLKRGDVLINYSREDVSSPPRFSIATLSRHDRKRVNIKNLHRPFDNWDDMAKFIEEEIKKRKLDE